MFSITVTFINVEASGTGVEFISPDTDNNQDNRMIPDSTPIIVGAGQYVERLDAPDYSALSAADIAARAARRACDDALPGGSILGYVDAIATTRTFNDTFPLPPPFGTSNNFPRSVAKRLDINPPLAIWTKSGGDSPQALVADLCARIAAGTARMTVLAGAEAISTTRRAQAQKIPLNFAETVAGDVEDHGRGLKGIAKRYHEIYGLRGAPALYAVLENARRHRLGLDRAAYARQMAQLFAPFSRVAAENPFSSSGAAAFSEGDLIEVGERNRMLADPYPLRLVAKDQVNQGAALLLTSVGMARTLGIPEHQWVYLHGHCQLEELDILRRADLGSSLAAKLAAKAALRMAGVTVEHIDLFDFYSCFPIAVSNVATDSLGLAHDDPRGLTVTGGLPYFGGPGNNYSMHAIASMVANLRARPGSRGFIGANGGVLSKYAAGVYSTRPAEWRSADHSDLQSQVQAQQAPPVVEQAQGQGVVDTYTIVYNRGTPAYGVVIGRLRDGGERFIARTRDGDEGTVTHLVAVDPLGLNVWVAPTSRGNQFAFSREHLLEILPRPVRHLRDRYEYCLVERRGHVLEIVINRPDVRNCLHPMANEELAEVMDVFLADEDLWVAILTGSGTESFCTGNDLKYAASGKPLWVPLTGFAGLTSRRGRDKPVIAAVNGFALGGGLEICLACDLVVADERAQLGLPETRVGLIAGAGGVVRLPRQIPRKLATELLLTGRCIGAKEGKSLGIVNRIAPAGHAIDGARALAAQLLEGSPTSIRATLRAMNEAATFSSEEDAAVAPSSVLDDLLLSEDCIEGITAFQQKRKPLWKGR